MNAFKKAADFVKMWGVTATLVTTAVASGAIGYGVGHKTGLKAGKVIGLSEGAKTGESLGIDLARTALDACEKRDPHSLQYPFDPPLYQWGFDAPCTLLSPKGAPNANFFETLKQRNLNAKAHRP